MPLLSRYHPGNYSEEQYQLDKRIVKHALFVSCSFVVVLWVIKFFESEFSLDFSHWGILPGSVTGLRGIIFSPLIHANFEHLIANSLPLIILTFSLFFFYRKSSYTIFVLIYLLSGFFVWLDGREAMHIGASGVIYGLAAFLFLSGIISHNIRLLTISLIVALIYGGMFWGIFPIKPEISWESHLWGGVSGFGLALLFRKSAPPEQLFEEDPETDEDNDYVGDEYNIPPDSVEPDDNN
jgi:membrane associated rhomboid family serine protease